MFKSVANIKMDFALPPGGLKRIFQQYDAIRSQGYDPPPWEPEVDRSNLPPQEVGKSNVPTQEGAMSNTPSDARRGKPKAWEAGLQEERNQAKMEERLHASHANKLLLDRERYPNGGVSFKQDEAGLEKAYNDKSTPGTYLDPNTHTLYVKGTVDAQDWYDDARNIPVWGDLKNSRRYHDAEQAYNYFTEHGQPIDRVVGHSLGGSVALELQKNKAIDYSRTFGAPVMDLNPLHRGTVERVRHPLDPVSVFDRGAKWGPLMAYPHTYTGFDGFDSKPVTGGVDHKALALKQRGMYV